MRQWTREEAVRALASCQTYSVVADDEETVMDGDGRNVCETTTGNSTHLGTREEVASLIAFVLNDYADAFGDK